jgi:hypothetical protein
MKDPVSKINPETGAREYLPAEVYGQFNMPAPALYEPEQKKPVKVTQREGNIHSSLLSVENFEHYMNVALQLSKSSLVPKNMIGKPADILLAMEMGLQLGIPMTQAIQDIAVVNGKPTLYGDGLLAAVQGHRDYEWIKEHFNEATGDALAAVCVIKRKNHEARAVEFSVADAKKASLWGKSGPWSQYPKRMLQMRARGFCIRDVFADALRGIKTEEEVSDYIDGEVTREVNPVLDLLKPKMITDVQIKTVSELVQAKGLDDERLSKAKKHFSVAKFEDLTEGQAKELIAILNRDAK